MSFWGSLGNLTGITSSYDGDAASAAYKGANSQLTQAYQNRDTQNTADLGLNTQLGNTNYYGNAQQVYGQQQTASNMLQGAANGTVPSAAAIQQGVGQQAANAGLQSAALSQQGAMNPALAGRNMLNAQAQAQQGIVADGTAARATEQATARSQYASLLNSMQTQQQQQGQLQYNQGQNMLGNQAAMHQQNYQNAQGTAQGTLANTMGMINGQTLANNAQATALGGTLSAAASAATGLPIGQTAKNVLNGATS